MIKRSMSVTKKMLSSLIVLTLVTSFTTVSTLAANTKAANASSQSSTKITTSNYSFNVDGVITSVKGSTVNGVKLYSLTDVAKALQLTSKINTKTKEITLTGTDLEIVFKANSKTVVVNKTNKSIANEVKENNGVYYGTIDILSDELGYYSSISGNNMVFTKLLSGSCEITGWTGKSQVLIAKETDDGLEYYIVDTTTRKSQKILGSELNVTMAAVSPDGQKIAYVTSTEEIDVYNIASKTTTQVLSASADDSSKYELQWSQSGDSLFFFEGSNSEIIAKITLANNTPTKAPTQVLTDGVKYKTDLRVSADGNVVMYSVTNAAVSSGSDQTDIDTTGTQPQIFVFDTTVGKDAKPQKLTTTTDNKVYSGFVTSSGSITGYEYLSSTDDDNSVPVIKYIGKDLSITNIVPTNLTILQTVSYSGKLMLLAVDANGKKGLYTLDINTYSVKKVCDVTDSVSKIFISSDGSSIAAEISTTNGTAVCVLNQNKLNGITK